MPVVEFRTEKLDATIMAMSRRSQNLPMDLMGQLISDAIDDVIQTEGKAGTQGAWDPFAESTLRTRAGGKLLQDTGRLANIQVEETGDYEVFVGSPAPYAHHHLVKSQFSPERDFLAIDFDDVLDEVADFATSEVIG